MTTQFSKSIFNTVYKDDFADDKHFSKILFNAGRALQGRELNQIQSILSAEIEKFGRNIFKDGAAVNPVSNVYIDNKYRFVKLNTTTYALPLDLTTLVGETATGDTSSVVGVILEALDVDGSDPGTLYVRYSDTSSGVSGEESITFTPGETITISGGLGTLEIQTTDTVENPTFGLASKAHVAEGDFFIHGHFIRADEQSTIIEKYSVNPTINVGFRVQEDIVTASDDVSLYDNQGDVPNLSAPGADRYRIQLILTREDLVDSDQIFIYVARIVDGEVLRTNDGSTEYNKILDILAERTKEESGNYTVNSFIAKFEDHDSDDSILELNVSAGIGYVNGYRADLPAQRITVNKPRSTYIKNNEVVPANYGNYVEISTLLGLPDLIDFGLVNLRSAVTHGGSTIGTARVRAIEEDGAGYRMYLFDINMNSGSSFRSTRSIGLSTIDYGDLILVASQAALIETSNNNTLFDFPEIRPATISDISLTVQRKTTAAVNGSGEATITLSAGGETFANTTDWIVTSDVDGDVLSPSINGSGTTSSTISGTGLTSGNISIAHYVNKASPTPRVKTLTEDTITTTIDSDGNGLEFLDLGKADIYSVLRTTLVDSDGTDVSSKFYLDNGQRDNYYGIGRMVLGASQTAPVGNVFTRFEYFAHSSVGDFFNKTSYDGQIDYSDIPNHKLADGSVTALRNVFDFRPRQDDTGAGYSAATARVNELPQNTDLITADASYYMPRRDYLILKDNNELEYLEGVSSTNPIFPDIPKDAMGLYSVSINAYTLDATEASINYIENKRYTMRDIGRLEKRVDKVEEYAVLSMLDLEASTIDVLDSSGLNRTKSGFLTDNFTNHLTSDMSSGEYKASMDITEGVLRPSFREKNIKLIYDSDLSSNTIVKGDNVYVKYDEILFLNQPQASGTENVNPFNLVNFIGTMVLSPSTDEWKDVVTNPVVINGGAAEFVNSEQRGNTGLITGSTNPAFDSLNVLDPSRFITTFERVDPNWRQWDWGWWGSQGLIDNAGRIGRTSSYQSNTFLNSMGINSISGSLKNDFQYALKRIAVDLRSSETSRTTSTVTIPFIRSRRVRFKAEGLLPNSRHFPFFDGKDVSDWVRGGISAPSETFQRFSTLPTENVSRVLTSHPGGSTTLTSDANGKIEGSFFIPNNANNRFATGIREFALFDISIPNTAEASSQAAAEYTAIGVEERTTITVSRTVALRRYEPIAQSFYVDTISGAYITKIRAYFSSKDASIPVQCQIRPMVNGYPSATEAVRNGIKFLYPGDVNISSDGTAVTDFELDSPIYLDPQTEYAVVFLSQCNSYNVFIATLGDFVLGSTEVKITKQPSMGSFYKSQNGSVWEPSQLQDLKYQVYSADFDTAGGFAVLENADVPIRLLPADPVLLDSGSSSVRIIHPNHGMFVNDIVNIAGLDSSGTIGGILGTSIMGARTITSQDVTGYRFAGDSSAISDARGGGDTAIASENMLMDVVIPSIETFIPNSTNTSLSAKFLTGKSYAGSETPYSKDTSYDTYLNKLSDYHFDAPRVIASPSIETSELGGGVRSASVKIDMVTGNSAVSPMIHMNRASLTTISNMIDNPIGSPTTGYNVPLTYVDETHHSSGAAASKYVTVPVSLSEDAVGLKVILAATRPNAANFDVYYKAIDEGELSTTDWVLAVLDNIVQSDENNVFREYRYTIGGPGGYLSPFTTFQIKIVMKSSNSSKVPMFRDLRVIALSV